MCVANVCGAGIACPSSRKPARRNAIPSLVFFSISCRGRVAETHPGKADEYAHPEPVSSTTIKYVFTMRVLTAAGANGVAGDKPLHTYSQRLRHVFLVQRTIGLENLTLRSLPAGVSFVTARRSLVTRDSRFFRFPRENRLSNAIEVTQQQYRPDSQECHRTAPRALPQY